VSRFSIALKSAGPVAVHRDEENLLRSVGRIALSFTTKDVGPMKSLHMGQDREARRSPRPNREAATEEPTPDASSNRSISQPGHARGFVWMPNSTICHARMAGVRADNANG